MVKEHHPDTNPGDKTAEERFKEINSCLEGWEREGFNPKSFNRIADLIVVIASKLDEYGKASWTNRVRKGEKERWENILKLHKLFVVIE